MQRYGKKIKRSKNLYKKRKHPARKVLEIVATVVLVGALGLVGYAAGKPLIEFLMGDRSDDPPVWVPPENGNGTNGTNGTNPENGNGTNGENGDNGTQTPNPTGNYNAVYAPASVLDNSASLGAYIQQQKSNGYNAVILEMKDTIGHLLYHSDYALLSSLADADITKGTLTPQQIIKAFENTGVLPVARINTLTDTLGARYFNDVSYVFYQGGSRWLDNTIEAGGKLWANPFMSGTQEYIAHLVGELSEAGFTEIILANNIFPDFKPFDVGILNPRFTNRNSRFEGLIELMKACDAAKGNSRLILEMSLRDIVENWAGLNNTAEVLRGRNSLDGFALLISYNAADFGSELQTGENSHVVLPAGKAARIDMLYKQAESQTGTLAIIPGLITAGLSDVQTEDVLRTFGDLGFENYAIR